MVHVFGVMLMLSHSLGPYNAAVRAGHWQQSPDFCMLTHPVPGIAGKTLGIVGFGELGSGVARIARAFGMEIVYHNRSRLDPALESTLGAEFVPLDALLGQSLLTTQEWSDADLASFERLADFVGLASI